MADVRVFDPTKDTSLKRSRTSTSAAWQAWKQSADEEHLLGGFTPGRLAQLIGLIQFDFGPQLADVEKVTKAELHIFSADDHEGFKTQTTSGTTLGMKISRARHLWTTVNSGEGSWEGAFNQPDAVNDPDANFVAYGHIHNIGLWENVINISNLMRAWLPDSILAPDGKPGKGLPNYGLHLTVSGSAPDSYEREWVVASKDHSNIAIRPFITLTVQLKGGPGITRLVSPDGDVAAGSDVFLRGEYEPDLPGDIIKSVEVRVTDPALPAGDPPAWTTKVTPSNTDIETSTFAVKVVPDKLKSGTQYEWTARVENQNGEKTAYASPKAALRYQSTVPGLTDPRPTGTLVSLVGTAFTATWTSSTQPASVVQVQLRPWVASTDPTWEDELLWDSGRVTVPWSSMENTRDDEGAVLLGIRQPLSVSYGGPLLPPGHYAYRMQAKDKFGGETDWKYGDVTLTAPYVVQPGGEVNLSQYRKDAPPFRIAIYGMGVNRAPGKLLAELTDASNVGASEYFNAGGEFYFTLPAIHPQVAVIEPYQCHYSLDIHTPEGWRPKAMGLITDFDASEDEVVFYGMDYPAVLGRMVDERFDPTNADLPTDKGGAKYVDKTIREIVIDQLNKARLVANSPLAFITVGDIADHGDGTFGMQEKVTIYSSFKQRLPFIAGLIDSSRAGTGRKTRIVCERDASGAYKWRVLSDPGLDRDNLRMEYGGIIQGFRTVPFSGWGTAVNAIGRTVLGTKVYSDRKVAPVTDKDTGLPIDIEPIYGAWPTTTMYQDIDDLNDLRRRTTQAAAQVAKVGKLMGLGIRVGSLGIKDMWDICDSVPIDIRRGVVDTSRFGSGYWTIWGWTWQSYPDGHADLNLTLAPRQDTIAADPDLIPSKPILDTPDFATGVGPPDTSAYPEIPGSPYSYIDIETGDIYEKQEDGTWLLVGNIAGPPGPDGADGPPGPTGPPGADGATLYTWVKYADTAVGGGISDDPTGKAYIGFAYNKTTPTESTNPADYAWSPNTGTTGPPGPPGDHGESLYTWVKYGDTSAGAGMSDNPAGKAYIGLAFNKTTATEGTNPLDYQWSLVLGPVGPVGPSGTDGADGADGATLYTWTKYADNAAGAGLSDSPTGKAYMGTATNKTTAVESTNPADYTWVKVLGDTGGTGPAGPGFDLTPPAVPTGLVLDTGLTQQTDGSLRPFISAQWDVPAVPGNLSHWEVGYTHAYPVTPKGWTVAVTSPGGLAPGTYDVVVTALGKSGGESNGLSVPVNIPVGTTGNIVVSGLLASVSGGLSTTTRVYVGLKDVDTGVAVPRQGAEAVGVDTATITTLPVAPAPVVPVANTAIDYAAEVVSVEPKPASGTKADDVYNNVRGATYFSVRLQAVSQANVRSGWSTPVTKVSAADGDAPPMPTGVEAGDGNKRIGVSWYQQPDTSDLDRYEVRWREVTTPASGWNYFDIYGTFAIVEVPKNRPDGVDPDSPESEVGVPYEGNVRAVDRSGNVDASHTPGTEAGSAVNVTDLDAGWSAAWTAQSLPTVPEDIAFRNLFSEKGQFIELTADKIVGGDLAIREDTDSPGSITIYDLEGRMAGRWSPYGWYLINPANPIEAIRGNNGVISFTKSGETDIDGNATPPWTWAEAVWTTGIGPDGINADYITTGAAQGGANRILNSGFELTPLSVPGSFTFDTAAEWDASVGATTNRTAAVAQFTQTLYTVP